MKENFFVLTVEEGEEHIRFGWFSFFRPIFKLIFLLWDPSLGSHHKPATRLSKLLLYFDAESVTRVGYAWQYPALQKCFKLT